jgi:hypothetical protein
MSDEHTKSPVSHWRKRTKGTPMSRDHAVRQGDITSLAFQILGRDRAIAFLNAENALLGGRPIAVATESAVGHLHVSAELTRMHGRQAEVATT